MSIPASLTSDNLAAVFKAYDVRGTFPEQIDQHLARAVGASFAALVRDDSDDGEAAIVVGYDMRPSSPALADAFAEGAARAGADVVLIGLASTDELYFASGHLGMAGVMFTASHNPAEYNGIKLCLSGARPVGMESGLATIRDSVAAGSELPAATRGAVSEQDLLEAYADHLLALAPVSGRRLRVVVDAGNGMAGLTSPTVLGRLGDAITVIPLYFELDGTFPNHEANPIDPENLRDLQREVRAQDADIGLAFDGDADRCFLVDERGELVSPSTVTALIAARELKKHPGSAIIHNLITSRAVPEIVRELGGTPVRTRVGHSFIKATMAETGAVFGGEHSGHFYFRDFWRADSGMLAALHVLAAAAEFDGPVSALLADYERYVLSGEINSTVADVPAVLTRIEEHFAALPDVVVDRLDGTTFEHPDWTVNVRPSNTEPLLRLNVEGKDVATMTAQRDAVLTVIRSH
jgi:phosphomannomutase